MKRVLIPLMISFLLLTQALASAASRQSGLVIKSDVEGLALTVSCDLVDGSNNAEVRTFRVRGRSALDGVQVGDSVTFEVVKAGTSLFAEDVQVHPFEPSETDPMQAHRMHLLARGSKAIEGKATEGGKLVTPGQQVPDFSLIDQNGRPITLSSFKGKAIAISFMYTRCALPNYCHRLSNNLGQVQQRFREQLGRDLILLTISFDPEHDNPEELTKYARTWNADANWHFLTGSDAEIHRVSGFFGIDSYLDEGLLAHSLHTLVIGRDGKLVANLEGNKFTARQLGDLVQSTLEDRDH